MLFCDRANGTVYVLAIYNTSGCVVSAYTTRAEGEGESCISDTTRTRKL